MNTHASLHAPGVSQHKAPRAKKPGKGGKYGRAKHARAQAMQSPPPGTSGIKGDRVDRLRRESATHSKVLQLDVTGLPQSWMTAEAVAGHLVSGAVAWVAGDTPLATLRGGFNSATGTQSTLEIPPIIALRGQSRVNLHDCVPILTNNKLFLRDCMVCCFCNQKYHERDLTREHIIPTSRQGRDIWVNVATACKNCNSRKGNFLLEELGWQLAYTPYVPSLYEDLLLRGRNIRADVREWLAAKLPKGSRLS